MRTRHALVAALAMILTLGLAAPASARPDTFEDTIFAIFPDLEHELVVFWNITRDDYCAWQADGFQDAPPVTQLVSGRFHILPNGAIVGAYAATTYLELWLMNEDAPLTGPCEDTDDSSAPWAVGTARVQSTDNDVDHDETVAAGVVRGNAFGQRGLGTVVDIDGATRHYSWIFLGLNDPNGNSRAPVLNETTLTP